jgi:four helix bundle protein
MAIKSFLDLEVYQESLQLAKEINFICNTFPSKEKFLLSDQMRRASRAVPSLIAEAWPKRKLLKEFRKYMRDAMEEACEMMNHLEQARLFGYLKDKKAKELIERYDKVTAKLSNLKDNWQNF